MPTFVPLILFSTTHCHLCEDATAILNSVNALEFTVIDISDNQTLINLYGTRIPVLQRTDNQAEINWPFDEDAVMHFLENSAP